jgi:hypothetical protein
VAYNFETGKSKIKQPMEYENVIKKLSLTALYLPH